MNIRPRKDGCFQLKAICPKKDFMNQSFGQERQTNTIITSLMLIACLKAVMMVIKIIKMMISSDPPRFTKVRLSAH